MSGRADQPGPKTGRRARRLGARVRFVTAVGILSLTWACAEASDGDARLDGGAPSGSVASLPETDSAPVAATTTSPPATGSAVGASSLAVALDGEGLRFVDVRSGSTRLIAFGQPAAGLREAVALAFGAEPTESGRAAECALEFARWDAGLTIWSARERFVGWAVRGYAPRLTTMIGITVGSTREEVESAYAVEIRSSTLGTEFTAGGLAGRFDGDTRGSRVAHLWAGQTCIAR